MIIDELSSLSQKERVEGQERVDPFLVILLLLAKCTDNTFNNASSLFQENRDLGDSFEAKQKEIKNTEEELKKLLSSPNSVNRGLIAEKEQNLHQKEADAASYQQKIGSLWQVKISPIVEVGVTTPVEIGGGVLKLFKEGIRSFK